MAAVVPIQGPVRERTGIRPDVLLGLVVLLLGALATWFADANLNGYRQQLFILCGIYAVIAVSLTLTSGFTGVFSLGQIGFLAIGAYVGALLTIPPQWKDPIFLPALPGWLARLDLGGWPPQLALLVACLAGGAVAALVASVVGLPLMRLSGHY